MNFVADENLETPIIERLREDGHQVLAVAEMEPGILDDEVLDRANQASALLLTNDKDFGELVFRLQQTPCGVILIRLAGLTNMRRQKSFLKLFNNGEKNYQEHSQSSHPKSFVFVS